MRIIIVGVLASFALVSAPSLAGAPPPTTLPPVYPDNAKGAKNFDWQKEWGTIHMNSFADGLNDPGMPSSNTGDVSCDNSASLPGFDPNVDPKKLYSLCATFNANSPIYGKNTHGGIPTSTSYSQIPNGIKYDIKRSFLGCMAQVVPNWSFTNVWDSDNPDYGPCGLQPDLKPFRLETMNSDKGTKFIHDYTGDDITKDYTDQGVPKWSLAQRKLAWQTRGNGGRSTLIYQPIYDARSNDDRAWLTDHAVGCQQQIINNCGYNDNGDIIRDVHACVGSPASGLMQDGPGYNHPVSHVFSPQEVADLQATAVLLDPTNKLTGLPTVYYAYQSTNKDGKTRTALSAIDPIANKDKFPDMVVDSKVDKIDTSDPSNTADKFLSNLKAYRFDVTVGDPTTKFVVVDPSDFFDLRLYTDGGKYASNYHNFQLNPDGSPKKDDVTKEKLVATWNTCPVLGATSGYSGICDPTSNESGCNLPIYGENAPTEFTDTNGNKTSYTNYSLQWSGYVKKWAVLTREQYLMNICGKYGCGDTSNVTYDDAHDREDFYIVSSEEGLNENPVIQITRSSDYCEPAEMISNPRQQIKAAGNLLTAVPDMPCIQYVQYQPWTDDKDIKHYSFVDLFNPVEASFDVIPPESDVVRLYDIDESGHPIYKSPVTGTGDNKYFTDDGKPTKTTGSVRLLDAEDPANPGKPFVDPTGAPAMISTYHDLTKDSTGQKVFNAINRNLASVQSTTKDEFGINYMMTTGDYQVYLDKNGKPCEPDTLHYDQGKDPSCNTPDKTKGVALPLKAGTATAIRFPHEVQVMSVDQNGKPIVKQSTCVVVRYKPKDPATAQRVFVPTNSYQEFQSFVTAAQNGIAVGGALQPGELGFFDCSARYQAKAETAAQLASNKTLTNNITDKAVWIDPVTKAAKSYQFQTWTGGIQCKDLVTKPACNQARIISAQRRCQLENGSEGRCGDCADAPDADDPKKTGFDFSVEKIGDPGHVEVLVSPMEDQNKCYFSAACIGMDENTCPPAGAPGGHVFCLAPETKITMADGSEKPIKKIKAGDEVVAFNAKRTRDGTLGKAKVAATAITKDQTIIQINDLKITPLHKIILANGRAVAAEEIKVGDSILKGSGQIEKVTKVKKNLKKITVYNLVLDKESDGYIAGGVRVMSYPLMKEMEITSGHAPLQAKNGKHRRYGSGGRSVSSLKQAR